MKTTVSNYKYVPGESGFETGVKGNRRPRNAVRGGHGSYRTQTNGTMNLYFNDGVEPIDISDDVRDILHERNKRLTSEAADKIGKAFIDAQVEINDLDGRIVGLDSMIRSRI